MGSPFNSSMNSFPAHHNPARLSTRGAALFCCAAINGSIHFRACAVFHRVPIEDPSTAAKQAVVGVVVEFEAHQATAVDRRMRDQDRPLGAGNAEL